MMPDKKSVFFSLIVIASCWMLSCNSHQGPPPVEQPTEIVPEQNAVVDPLLIEIKDMEAKAKRDSVMDRAVGLRLLRAYQEYYNQHAGDSLGMHYLFEAGRVADALGKYDKAIELLRNYHDGMRDIDRKAEAAYMIAFIYDAHLKSPKKAKESYQEVIDLYPKSIWAQQAASAMQLVGKSDEELLKFLQEKNKSNS